MGEAGKIAIQKIKIKIKIVIISLSSSGYIGLTLNTLFIRTGGGGGGWMWEAGYHRIVYWNLHIISRHWRSAAGRTAQYNNR